jgi:hypothetical protein
MDVHCFGLDPPKRSQTLSRIGKTLIKTRLLCPSAPYRPSGPFPVFSRPHKNSSKLLHEELEEQLEKEISFNDCRPG